jgi:putative transposase
MPTPAALLRLVSMFFHLVRDAVRFLLLGARSSAALKAENLFLRKRPALHLERQAKPRRANDATRLALALLSNLLACKEALVIVKPETMIRRHRKGFQLCSGA